MRQTAELLLGDMSKLVLQKTSTGPTGTTPTLSPSHRPVRLHWPFELALQPWGRSTARIRPNPRVPSCLSTESQINAAHGKRSGTSTNLNHLFEDWFEILGTTEHERIHSQAQLASWSAMAMAHGSNPYREAPFRFPQILEGVVMNSGLLDIILDIVFVRHGV
jgi:hypothetical protein